MFLFFIFYSCHFIIGLCHNFTVIFFIYNIKKRRVLHLWINSRNFLRKNVVNIITVIRNTLPRASLSFQIKEQRKSGKTLKEGFTEKQKFQLPKASTRNCFMFRVVYEKQTQQNFPKTEFHWIISKYFLIILKHAQLSFYILILSQRQCI